MSTVSSIITIYLIGCIYYIVLSALVNHLVGRGHDMHVPFDLVWLCCTSWLICTVYTISLIIFIIYNIGEYIISLDHNSFKLVYSKLKKWYE